MKLTSEQEKRLRGLLVRSKLAGITSYESWAFYARRGAERSSSVDYYLDQWETSLTDRDRADNSGSFARAWLGLPT